VKQDTEEITYLVPEINVRISSAWVTLITYCQENLPHGSLKIEINNAQPGKKLKEVPAIRFDKAAPLKAGNGNVYLVQSLDIRIPQSWINLIQWCQNFFNSGIIEFKLVAAQPTDLLGVSQRMNFSKPETIPAGLPLSF